MLPVGTITGRVGTRVTPSIDPAGLLEERLAQASPELLRELLTTFINTLMSAEADAVCGAAKAAFTRWWRPA